MVLHDVFKYYINHTKEGGSASFDELRMEMSLIGVLLYQLRGKLILSPYRRQSFGLFVLNKALLHAFLLRKVLSDQDLVGFAATRLLDYLIGLSQRCRIVDLAGLLGVKLKLDDLVAVLDCLCNVCWVDLVFSAVFHDEFQG